MQVLMMAANHCVIVLNVIVLNLTQELLQNRTFGYNVTVTVFVHARHMWGGWRTYRLPESEG